MSLPPIVIVIFSGNVLCLHVCRLHCCNHHLDFSKKTEIKGDVFKKGLKVELFKTSLGRGALNDLFFLKKVQNVNSEVASKKPIKATASKYTISYQNKEFNKSNVY